MTQQDQYAFSEQTIIELQDWTMPLSVLYTINAYEWKAINMFKSFPRFWFKENVIVRNRLKKNDELGVEDGNSKKH